MRVRRRKRKNGSWIMVRYGWEFEAELADLSLNARMHPIRALGALVRVWSFAARAEPKAKFDRARTIDALAGKKGFARAMLASRTGTLLRHDGDYFDLMPGTWWKPEPYAIRGGLSTVLKREVLAAGACAKCGATTALSVDHIIPLSRGGTHDRENLQCLCLPCNMRKSWRVPA